MQVEMMENRTVDWKQARKDINDDFSKVLQYAQTVKHTVTDQFQGAKKPPTSRSTTPTSSVPPAPTATTQLQPKAARTQTSSVPPAPTAITTMANIMYTPPSKRAKVFDILNSPSTSAMTPTTTTRSATYFPLTFTGSPKSPISQTTSTQDLCDSDLEDSTLSQLTNDSLFSTPNATQQSTPKKKSSTDTEATPKEEARLQEDENNSTHTESTPKEKARPKEDENNNSEQADHVTFEESLDIVNKD